MSVFHLVVFDLDGTLIDSRRDLAEATNATLEACGAPPLGEASIVGMIGDGGRIRSRLRIIDEHPRAAVPMHRLFRIHAQLFAHALDQDVLFSGNAGLVDVGI